MESYVTNQAKRDVSTSGEGLLRHAGAALACGAQKRRRWGCQLEAMQTLCILQGLQLYAARRRIALSMRRAEAARMGLPAESAEPGVSNAPRRSMFHGVTWARRNAKWRAQVLMMSGLRPAYAV